MPKRILKFLVFMAMILVIAYAGLNVLIDFISREVMDYVVENMRSPNLELTAPSFDSARISSFIGATWKNFELTAIMTPGDASKLPRKVRMNVERLTLEAEDFLKGRFVVLLSGLSLSIEYPSEDAAIASQNTPTLLQDGAMAAPLQANIFNRAELVSQIRKFASELRRLSEEGRTSLPVKFTAEEVVTLNDDAFTLSIWVEKKSESYQLMASKEDLEFISKNVLSEAQTSTPADIEIISNNPIRAPQLLRMRSKAGSVSSRARKIDPTVPEDAYRHVLWSYLLTREYGAEFAKKVTDAHETATDFEEKNRSRYNAAHRMDLNNAEVGRQYAQHGYPESRILDLVRSDPKVIR